MPAYEKMVVIFIDILGSKDMSSFEEKYKIHEIFHNSIKYGNDLQNTEAKSNVIYTRKLYSFSDCAFIFYKYKEGVEDSRKDIRKLAQTALFNSTLLTIELLMHGYLIRGGATLGNAYFDDLSFFGPAVDEAYILESRHADSPRILISNDLGKLVYDFEVETYNLVYSESNPLYKFMPKRSYNPTIVREYQSSYVLNYSYILEDSGNFSSPRLSVSFKDFKSTVLENIENKIQKTDEEKILKKLNWIKIFIESSRLAINPDASGITIIV